MALNPGYLVALEAHGLTNADLALLVALLESKYNGSIAWHCAQGVLCKYEFVVFGKTGDADTHHLATLLQRR
jgi:hypothetical protein